MGVKLVVLLLLRFTLVTTIHVTVYSTASFNPTSTTDTLITLVSLTTMDDCLCQCYNNMLCVTGTYFGIKQTCTLFSAHLWEGKLRLVIDMFTSVFSFNRTTTLGKYSHSVSILHNDYD
jgi:hypothetical protein